MHPAVRAATSLGLLFIASVTSPLIAAESWTRFRGPNGTGESEAKTIPTTWTEQDYNWKAPLPGVGHSSPTVWGQRVFLMSADPKDATRYLLCFSTKDGRELWRRVYKSSPHRLHPRSSYASCTPAVDARHVYFAWSTPEETTLLALDHDGKDLWRKDLGRFQSMHGFGTSPMLYKNLVILNNMQQNQQLDPGEQPGTSALMAFDAATGKRAWTAPRESSVANYGVPCVWRDEQGRELLICTTTKHGIAAHDPQTGREVWSTGPATFSMRTVSSPVVAGGLIFGSTGKGGGPNYVVAVRPGPTPEIAYQIKTHAPYVPTPVAKGELLFLWFDGGYVTCIDAPTGKIHWRERIGGGFSGSPVRVGDRLYGINEAGVVVVLAADSKFKLLAKNDLGSPSRSTPAVADGRMYLRTYTHLLSIGRPARTTGE